MAATRSKAPDVGVCSNLTGMIWQAHIEGCRLTLGCLWEQPALLQAACPPAAVLMDDEGLLEAAPRLLDGMMPLCASLLQLQAAPPAQPGDKVSGAITNFAAATTGANQHEHCGHVSWCSCAAAPGSPACTARGTVLEGPQPDVLQGHLATAGSA